MFSDPTVEWHPFPSPLDGIDRPPFVLDRGLWKGRLGLIVLEPPPRRRAFGVLIKCEAYLAIEEMIYSVADHGAATYDGAVYVKEATTSGVLSAYEAVDPLRRKARQFLLVGSDYCYETVGFDQPTIWQFLSDDAAHRWHPGAEADP